MSKYVALLRGINVSGKHTLPMKELVAIFDDLGCLQVRTYIQSGNVVFETETSHAGRIPALVSKAILSQFGFDAPVVVRAAKELKEIVRRNPFLRKGAELTGLHVAFLAELPDPTQIAALDPNRSPGDSFVVQLREVYLHCPNGLARSKLTNAYFDARLGTTSTVRNWNTVLKLAELVDSRAQSSS